MTDPSRARIHVLDDRPVRSDGSYVLYWMVANRRLSWNFALDRAVEHAQEAGLPLVVLEALRVGYRWAADRHHAFVLQGMAEHREALAGSPVRYYAYVEPEPGAGKGLLEALAADASVVVTDLFPAFFLPRMVDAAAELLSARFEAVDSNGLLPLADSPRPHKAAYPFRRFLQKTLGEHLLVAPERAPLWERDLVSAAALPASLTDRWPEATDALLGATPDVLADLPVDHAVPPVELCGGRASARATLERFLEQRLARYGEQRNDPDAEASSGLSPHLHWGHLSVHEVFDAVARHEGWSPARLGSRRDGARTGWWGMSPDAEAFLDELVTWRELGFVYCHHVPGYDRYETLSEWARDTLEEHASDPRPWLYDRDAFEEARTHDELWNAAQRQLRREGVIHNYLRMLWGKKILEWTRHPREALDVMIELNNRWAIDGRDPNSYSGIFWVLGRFDRGWPERPVFGKVRSMSSDRTRAKVDVDRYLDRFASRDPADARG